MSFFDDPVHTLLEMLMSSSISKTYFKKIVSEAMKLRRTREMPEGQPEIVAIHCQEWSAGMP